MSPSIALAYLFWTQHRRGLMIVAGYLLIVVLFCRIVSGETFASALNEGRVPGVAIYVLQLVFLLLWVGLAVALMYLLCILTFSREVRFEARESGFPSRLLHLPLPTLTLAGWPMLWGSITLALGWLVLAGGAFRPCGYDVPLGWPALLLAAVLAWLQAIIWTPFPLPWVRALLFIPWSGISIFVPAALLAFDVSAAIGYLILAVLLPTAYLTAIQGVSRARRGENGYWSRPVWLRWPWAATGPRPPFVSAAQAQFWLEWRRCGLAFPLAVAFCSLFWFPLVIFLLLPELLQDGQPTAASISFLLLFVLASLCGMAMGKLPKREQTLAVSSFLATRPLTIGGLIRAKLKVAALSTLAGWAVLGMELLLWVLLSDHALSDHDAKIAKELLTMRQPQSLGRFGADLLLLFGSAFALTWAHMVGNLWMGLWMGLKRPVLILMMATFFLSGPSAFVLPYVGRHLKESPQHWQTVADLLTWLASGAVVLKSLAAVWALSQLKRNALVSSPLLIGTLAAWGVLVIGLLTVLRGLIPREIMPTSGLVLGIVLLVPLTRLALAPLALAWNRHR